MLRVLSLGAGVQSTTLALLAAKGEIAPIDCAVFADTQSEPRVVYEHLARLTAPGVLPFPVHTITKGSLREEILDATQHRRAAWGRPPFFLKMQQLDPETGLPLVGRFDKGMSRRQCTQDYKLDLIYRKVRELAGIRPKSRGPASIAVEQVIGISLDEAHRMKSGRFRWTRNVYPLIDLQMNRLDCLKKLDAWGWSAPRSACTFCPYHSDESWLRMKREDPESFADAVAIDHAIRGGLRGLNKGVPFLHQSLQPLDEVNFEERLARPRAKRQIRLYLPGGGFGNECEGVCGV